MEPLICSRCGAPLVRCKENNRMECPNCKTLYALSKTEEGKNGIEFWYPVIERKEIQIGGKTSHKVNRTQKNQIQKIDIVGCHVDVSKLNDKVSVTMEEALKNIESYYKNAKWEKIEKLANEQITNKNSDGIFLLYGLLAKAKINQNLFFTEEDFDTLQNGIKSCSPQRISQILPQLIDIYGKVTDEQSYNRFVSCVFSFNYDNVFSKEEQENMFYKCVEHSIEGIYKGTFKLLVEDLLPVENIGEYIDYNCRFGSKFTGGLGREYFLKAINADEGNAETHLKLLVYEINNSTFNEQDIKNAVNDIKDFLRYSKNEEDKNKNVSKVVKIICNCKSLNNYHINLMYEVIGYYDDYRKHGDELFEFANKLLKKELFSFASDFYLLVLSTNNISRDVFIGLLLSNVNAKSFDDVCHSKILIDESKYWEKCYALSNDSEQKELLSLAEKQKKSINDKKINASNNNKRRLIKFTIICSSVVVLAGIVIGISFGIKGIQDANASNYDRKYNINNFSLVLNRKNQSSIASKYSNGIVTAFYFNLHNDSSESLSSANGNIKFFEGPTNNIGSFDINFNATNGIEASSTKEFTLNIDQERNSNSLALYNDTINVLEVHFKFNSVTFANGEIKTYDKSEFKNIKPYGGDGGNETEEEINKSLADSYEKAVNLYNGGNYNEALIIFKNIKYFEDSSSYIDKCNSFLLEQKYIEGVRLFDAGEYEQAMNIFMELNGYKDSSAYLIKANNYLLQIKYDKANSYFESGDYVTAYKLFIDISTFSDSAYRIIECQEKGTEIAKIDILKGNYREASDYLSSIGLGDSDIYMACEKASSGIYSNLINALSLSDFTIPNGVNTIVKYSFANCTGLKTVNLPESLLKIDDYAFQYCTGLKKVVIPNTVVTIGEKVFDYATNIYEMTLPIINNFKISKFYNSGSFETASNLETINITSGTTIPNGYFNYLTKLQTINLPNTIIDISDYGFSGVPIKSIDLPSSLKNIGDYAFYNSKISKELIIKNGVETIGNKAFGNTYLTSINLPSSLTRVGANLFMNDGIDNYNLRTINYDGTKTKWLAIASKDWDEGLSYDNFVLNCKDASYTRNLYGTGVWTNK